jgi:serine/threonine protein kinase
MGRCPSCGDEHVGGLAACPHGADPTLVGDSGDLEDPSSLEDEIEEPLAAGAPVGEYRIDGPVADGGFGTVYRARHPLIGKDVAVKVLKRRFSSDPAMVQRFLDEARAVNQIRHRNIVDIFAFGVLGDGRHYFVMELLEGLTLNELIQRRGRLRLDAAMPILKQLARALGAAHAAGIAHRDLKPENVFITFDEDGVPVPKLLDFGIAKLVQGRHGRRDKTRSGMMLGTPLYMSPEQIHGAAVDHRTDIYSLGVLIHELLAGQPPFVEATALAVMNAHVGLPAPPLSTRCEGIPPAIDRAVGAMLEKEPGRRPQSVTAAMGPLLAAFEGAPSVPHAAGLPAARGEDGRERTETSSTDVALGKTLAVPAEASNDAGDELGGGAGRQATGPRTRPLLVGMALISAIVGAILLSRSAPPSSSASTEAPPASASSAGFDWHRVPSASSTSAAWSADAGQTAAAVGSDSPPVGSSHSSAQVIAPVVSPPAASASSSAVPVVRQLTTSREGPPKAPSKPSSLSPDLSF